MIIPAFNAADTIAATLRSVQMQSEKSLEIIVVDDGSTDETMEVLTAIAQNDHRVLPIRQVNQGPSAARNNGVRHASSDVVAFLDADDSWHPMHLKLGLELLESDARIGIAFGVCRLVDHDGRDTGARTRSWQQTAEPADVLACNPTATCSNLIVRKTVFDTAGFMRMDMVHAEDQEWLFRVAHAGWHLVSHAVPTVNYRISPNGLSSDVPKMHAGWKTFIGHARNLAPLCVEQNIASATADMNLYYAQRWVSAKCFGWAPWRHLTVAMQSAPYHVICRMPVVGVLTFRLIVGGLLSWASNSKLSFFADEQRLKENHRD